MDKFNYFRELYPNFNYNSYSIEEEKNELKITYNFEIEGLTEFTPVLRIPKNIISVDVDNKFLEKLVFNLGMVELVSYFKATCSPNVRIKAGFLDEEQISFYKKLYYNGLGEFLYTNKIGVSLDDLMNIEVLHDYEDNYSINYEGSGNLIPVGGGKDSCVSLELLRGMDNTCFAINPKEANIKCVEMSGYDSIHVKRILDKRLIDLNSKGFLNGHTPFSAIVAFTSYLVSYLSNKKYIVLSNEGSANQATVIGTNINHQYSKTYEFECDFNNYTNKYFGIDIHYFSFLRPISEFQIGMIFSRLKKYHKIFKSCNVGSKGDTWNWCGACPKCLFVYMILSPFLKKEELIDIFGSDLFENQELLDTFIELLGYSDNKPFECVGTIEESRYACSLTIKNRKEEELPYLLKYYKDNYECDFSFQNGYDNKNNLPLEFETILRSELEKYDKQNYRKVKR